MHHLLKPIIALSVYFIFTVATCKNRDSVPDQEPSSAAHLKQTDWTAGIISDSTGFPADTFSAITDVRTGRHEEFDRIVFEISGPGIPDYHIEYIDEPVRMCGSGNPLYLPGDGWLMIRFHSARMHTKGSSTIEDRDRRLELPVILRLVATCDFENIVTWVAAVSSPNRYRVMELGNPSRLVVDIRH
ncbi:MAG: hypothetical protein GF401_18280 [Chitinivibrionales bacterium]|nr:hypothetical protein [Chitinivibrionales bacterium]